MLSTKHALTATVWMTDNTATQLALTLVQEGGPTLVLDMDQLQGMVVHLDMMLIVVVRQLQAQEQELPLGLEGLGGGELM